MSSLQAGGRAPYIEWTKELEVGIPLVDKDHKVLVSLLNQVYDAIGNNEERAVLGSVLNSLSEYTNYHFAREEKLQEVAGYGDLQAHHQRHLTLAKQVHDICVRYEADSGTVQGDEILQFLKSWLVEHILKHDMSYRDACIGNQAAYDAAEAMLFSDNASTESVASPQAPKPVVWSALSVLIVEDNRNFQLIIQTILKSLGVRTMSVASGGAEGLEFLQTKSFDLVLCDWRMEGMDGLEFVIKAREMATPSKIIMMSGYGSDDVRERALAAGVNEFLEKPITARGFLEMAARVMA